MPDFSIAPFDERVYAFLGEAGLPEDLVDPGQHRSHALAELYVLELVIDLVEQLGMTDLLARPRTAAELLEARELAPGFRAALCWLLERLVAAGKLTRDGQGRDARYRLPAPLPPSGREAVRAEALAFDPSYAPAYALLDEAAAVYPRVARGETTGERALFQRIALWCAYFSNENRYYAINNRLGAAAAAARLGAEPACVLEVGAGLGSATEALLELLSARGHVGALTSYRFTEPVPFFRRRAQRTLEAAHPGVPFVFSARARDVRLHGSPNRARPRSAPRVLSRLLRRRGLWPPALGHGTGSDAPRGRVRRDSRGRERSRPAPAAARRDRRRAPPRAGDLAFRRSTSGRPRGRRRPPAPAANATPRSQRSRPPRQGAPPARHAAEAARRTGTRRESRHPLRAPGRP